jgi:D-glycero-D-manno-heptose 1,7-bisphosphate phosphatase
MKQKAIFLDRDGVINHLVERENGKKTAPWNLDEFRFCDGIQDATKTFKKLGYKLFVVTNQPDVEGGKGILTYSDLETMHKMITNWLGVDEIMFCEYRNTIYYKPNNGLIEAFIKNRDIDRDISYMIGDTWKDIVAGHRSGLTTILIGNDYVYPFEYKDIQPDFIVDDCKQASQLIKEFNKI